MIFIIKYMCDYKMYLVLNVLKFYTFKAIEKCYINKDKKNYM